MIGFFQRRSIKIYSKNKKSLPALDAPIIDVEAQQDQLLKPDTSRYGIDAVIALMRKLPQGDLDTIVSVLKHTLDSVDVDIRHVIEDAEEKVESINGHLIELRTEITQFREGIKARIEEISNLEADLAETLDVKEDLVYAEKITSSGLEESLEPPLNNTDTVAHDAHGKQDEFIGPLPEAESSGVGVTAPSADLQAQSPHSEYEEDDGIPVVEAIDLDRHDTYLDDDSAGESLKETIKKTKSKQGKAVTA